MRVWLLVVVVALAGCGWVEAEAGDTGGENGPPCYLYVVDPGIGSTSEHCTDADGFCWWTGRNSTDYPEPHDCSPDAAEYGCYYRSRGHELYGCALVACGREMIDNDPCCYGVVRHQHNGEVGPWDGVHGALCVD